MTDIDQLAHQILQQDRRALARGITLVESQRSDHREQSIALMQILQEHPKRALRIGLSGTPGVGKSTFIEALGSLLTARGSKVAVLAVDPSSLRSGGSILGDKTRMDRLSRDPMAFIRPSPSQSHLGGVTRRSRDAVALCEAAGFDVVFIETVGVGQSETIVSEMSDIFLLLLAPAGGDELQGVKRGIMEMADIILVNKADGELSTAANRTCADYSSALRLLRKRAQDPSNFPIAMTVSALTLVGLEAAWQAVLELTDWRKANGHFEGRRAQQARFWFEEDVKQGALDVLNRQEIRNELERLGLQVEAGGLSPARAAERVLKRLSQLK